MRITDKIVLFAVIGFIAFGAAQTTLAWALSFSARKRWREERRRRKADDEWT